MQGGVLTPLSAGTCAQPGGHRAAVPDILLRRRSQERLAQLLPVLGSGQERVGMRTRRAPVGSLTVIEEAFLALVGEAACDSADPVG